MDLNIVVLAAGQGTRMKSKLPKVLQPLAGRPLLSHVLDTCKALNPVKTIVVYGHGGDLVQTTINELHPNQTLLWAEQKEQLGTGHAVQQALGHLDGDCRTLVLYGDVPLVSTKTLQEMLSNTNPASVGLLTVNLKNPSGYGRIIRDSSDNVTSIVEEKDADECEKAISEVNTGIMLLGSTQLNEWLPQLKNENVQGEYYLTDLIALASNCKVNVLASIVKDPAEVEGVNDRKQLAKLERIYQGKLSAQLMEEGVALADPSRIDIRGKVRAGSDCFIDANCLFEGDVVLGEDCIIEPNCYISNTIIGNGVLIKANSVIENSEIGDDCDIGPFARIRPGTQLCNNAKVGNFVETKKSVIGEGSKINHLSYVGDADIGREVNVGAGTITCNYDGVNKHKTVIGDKAFIGSNTSLVAPVDVGEGATVGAGSTVSNAVEANALTLTRAKKRTINTWQRPKKK